jgi:carboxyl-terminal processing protease
MRLNVSLRHIPIVPIVPIMYATCVLLLLLIPFQLFQSKAATILDNSDASNNGSNTEQAEIREKNLLVFNDVWQTISERYYDPKLNGADWQTLGTKFRPLAADARNSSELYSVLRRMLSQLHDAHTRIYAPSERFDWQRPRLVTTGVSIREVAGMPVVVAVDPGSMAQRAGIRSGDKIISIDGEPVLSVYSRLLKEATSASTVVAARSQAIGNLLDGPQGTFVKVGFVSADGKERTALLRREVRERRAELRVRKIKDGYIVVEFSAFTDQIASEFANAVKDKLSNARGIIFDLRNNGGGEVDVMADIASIVLPPGKDLGKFINRQGKVALAMKTRIPDFPTLENNLQITVPIAVLTSERTASSAEILAAALKDVNRATIIGQPTCGCVLGLRRSHTLPDGGELNVSELDYQTAKNKRLEGVGVMPDEIVAPSLMDLRAHRDVAIERAIKNLSSKF